MGVAVSIADGSSGGIDYDSVMRMDLCEISMIYDTICKRQERAEREMKKGRK